jgi:hypothetical protein
MYYYSVKVEISRLLQYQCLFNVLKSRPDSDFNFSLNLLSLLSWLVRHLRMILRKNSSITFYRTNNCQWLCRETKMILHSCEYPGLNNKKEMSWSKWENQDRIGVEIAECFSHMRGLGTSFFSLQQWIYGKQLDLKIMNILLSHEIISVVM